MYDLSSESDTSLDSSKSSQTSQSSLTAQRSRNIFRYLKGRMTTTAWTEGGRGRWRYRSSVEHRSLPRNVQSVLPACLAAFLLAFPIMAIHRRRKERPSEPPEIASSSSSSDMSRLPSLFLPLPLSRAAVVKRALSKNQTGAAALIHAEFSRVAR